MIVARFKDITFMKLCVCLTFHVLFNKRGMFNVYYALVGLGIYVMEMIYVK